MPTTLSPGEEGQLAQTIEMFEIITQSQPQDYQSLEILKEAYAKLGREQEVVTTSKRIAQAYVQMGQLSSAILEYETILQRCPDDPDVLSALAQIESRATSFPGEPVAAEPAAPARPAGSAPAKDTKTPGKAPPKDMEDGRRTMQKIFVESKLISAGDFDLCWPNPDLSQPGGIVEPFIQILADKGILPVDKALKILTDKSRLAYLPLDRYELDTELARTFPADVCRRWCVLPFDRMGKSVLVATANPFNQQAVKDLAESTPHRLLHYLTTPAELVKCLRKVFR
jgi:tetratricopeptide (TPR) repeat protein